MYFSKLMAKNDSVFIEIEKPGLDGLLQPRRWAGKYYNLQRWNVAQKRGHFAPMEQPQFWSMTFARSSGPCGTEKGGRTLRPAPWRA